MGEKQFPVFGQLDPPGGPGKESRVHRLLQLSDRLADCGLADKEFVGGVRDVAGQGDRVENAVEG